MCILCVVPCVQNGMTTGQVFLPHTATVTCPNMHRLCPLLALASIVKDSSAFHILMFYRHMFYRHFYRHFTDKHVQFYNNYNGVDIDGKRYTLKATDGAPRGTRVTPRDNQGEPAAAP